METPKKVDDDDIVDTDTDRETNIEESEEIYQIEESKKRFRIRWIRKWWKISDKISQFI